MVDTIGEGLEEAAETIGRLRGPALFWVVFALTTLILLALGRRQGRAPEGLALAGFIALGIGLHNLGEGLAVGAALATGSAALAAYLVIGFTIHNVTEGVGIAAPLAREHPRLIDFVWLAALGRRSGHHRNHPRHPGGKSVLDRALLRHWCRRHPAGHH